MNSLGLITLENNSAGLDVFMGEMYHYVYLMHIGYNLFHFDVLKILTYVVDIIGKDKICIQNRIGDLYEFIYTCVYISISHGIFYRSPIIFWCTKNFNSCCKILLVG